jgi:hypothetical protein
VSGTLNAILTQNAMAIKYRGTQILLRRSTVSANARNPVSIPPIVEAPTVSAAVATGATALPIAAAVAEGQLSVGDQITVNFVTYTVAAAVSSTGAGSTAPGFANVPLRSPVVAPIAKGAAITFSFATDQQLYANIGSFALGLVDGSVIEASDLRIVIAAWDPITGTTITPPRNTDQIVLNGSVYQIRNVMPLFAMGTAVKFQIQARA